MTSQNPLDLSVTQACARFATASFAPRHLSLRTRIEYLADLRDAATFLAAHGVQRVNVVTPAHLKAYLASLAQRRLTLATRRRRASSLRVFYAFLVQAGHLAVSPALRLIPPDRPHAAPQILTDEQCHRLTLAAQHHPRDSAILTLFLQTGLRRLELAQLLRSDLTLPATVPQGHHAVGRILVRGTTAEGDRLLTIDETSCRAIAAMLAHRPRVDDPHLFLSKFGCALGSWGVEDVVQKYLALIGVQGTPQALRHTFAVQRLRAGMALPLLQEVLGHRHLTTTARYVALAREQMVSGQRGAPSSRASTETTGGSEDRRSTRVWSRTRRWGPTRTEAAAITRTSIAD